MNKVYKCVWNAALGVWSVASELASAKKKTKSCVSLSDQGENPKSAIQNILLISAAASIGAMSSSAYAAPIHAEDTASAGNLNVQNVDFWKLLTDGYYNNQTKGNVYTTGGAVHLGNGATANNGGLAIGTNAAANLGDGLAGATSIGTSAYSRAGGTAIGSIAAAGNSAVALGRNALASKDSVAIGRGSAASAESSMALGRSTSATASNSVAIGNTSSVSQENTVSFGNADLQRKLTNVAKGQISSTSVDAINGSQLHSANSKVADALGGGSTVDANGNITAPVYSVDGKNVNNVGDAITNVDGRVTNNSNNIATNTTNIAGNTKDITDLNKTLTDGAFSVSANGEGATKVAKDAVIDFANTDNNITIAQDGTNLTFGLADQLNVKTGVTVGNSTLSSDGLAITGGPTISKGGIDAANTIVSNVAAGKVTADSTDAINGSQLHSANSKVADALGGGSTVDANGNITAPVYSVDGKNVSNVGDAISNVDGRVTNNSNDIATNTTNISTNTNNIAGNTKDITDLNKTLTDGAFSVSANGEGATKVAKDAVIDFANTDNNITIAQDGTNLTFGLADQLNVKTGVTVGNSTLSSDGLAIAGGPTISKGGIDAGNTIVSNIKDGVAATDAVSKGQLDKGLRDSGLIDADGNSIDAVTYTADGNVVLKDNDGKGTLISNVAAGKVTADSTDAINGSQLHSANSKVADALGGGSTVDANGNITAPVYSVDGKNVSNVGDAITNVDGRVTNNTTNISTNTNNIAGNTKNITELNKTLTDGAFSVSANGEGATKVAKDAVIDFANTDNNITIAQDGTNLTFGLADQLNVKTGVTVGNSTLSSDGLAIAGGPTISKGGIDAGNTIVSNIKDGVAATDAVSKGQLDKGLRDSGLIDADGNSIDAVTYTADGNVVLKDNDGKGTLISNVAAGKVTADSTDAINGSQLHSANSKVADALGGGSTVDADGNITAPVYRVDGKNVSNVGDAITNVDSRVTNNTTNISTNTNNIAGNTKDITDLSKTLTEGAFSVSANGEGASKVAKDAVIDFANTDNNITIAQDGTNLTFGLADQLNVKTGVTVGNSTLSSDGLAITGGPTISKGGIDAGNTIVSNIKDGVAATDAVSKGQLDKGLRDSGLIDADGNSIDAVTYTADGNVVLKDNDGKGTLISNVTAGKVTADSTDAINGGQLHGANSKVADALGGGSTVDANGNITAPVYSVDGKNVSNVGDAITNVDGRVTNNTTNITANTNNIADLGKTLTEGAFSVSANGEGATKVAKDAVIDFANTDNNITIAQDGTNLTFGLADQLNVKTGVTVGNSTLSSDGLAIAGGPSISKGGIDAGNTIVSNIKDGVAATDAVSKGQLDKGLRDSGLIDADGNSIDAVTYTADGNVVLKDNDGKGTLISNVAAGKVTADSTDAINGGQLHSANSKVADALGGGSTVDANGNITAPVYSVDGKNINNVGDAITNVDGRVTNNSNNIATNTTNITTNTNNIAGNTKNITDLSKTLTEGAFSVSANGEGATKVAKDAVIDFANTDNNITIAQDGSNLTFGLADQLNVKTGVTVGNSTLSSDGLAITGGPTISKGGIDAGNTIVSNVAAGKVTADSTDAINGGQLHSANSKVADALGGGSTVDANGNITAPVYSVDGKNVSNVGDAITNVDGRVTNNSNNIATNTTNIAGNTKNITDLSKTLTDGAFSVSANGEGATKVAKDAVINFANTDNNITIAQDGTNLTFGLADQLNVKTGVTVGNSTLSSDGLAITGGPTISKGGIDAGNTIVSNIKDGVAATDAVSKGQLDKGLRDSGLIDADGNSIDAVTYTADGNVVLKDNDGKGTLISNVAAGKVTADSTDAINGSQLHSANSKVADALGGGSTVDANGNITAPVYSVDGKNVSNVGDAITSVDGRVTNNTTNITANSNNIAGNTKDITELNKTLTDGAFSVSANGEGATKVAKDAVIDFANTDNNITIAQDGTNLTFGLADQLNVKTGVTVGNSTLSSDGLAIAGGPTISKGGIDAGNTIVSNIKDGVAATDAVSKGQLDKGLRDSGLIDADGNSIDAVTYTADGNVVLKDNDGKGTLISNVAAGKVTADSTDAINGSQLHAANSKVADALGGGSTVDANGNITAPVYSVDGKNVSNVGDAITNVDGRVTNNSNNIATNTTNITTNTNNIAGNTKNITDLNKTLTEGAFSVSANGEGASKVAKDAVIDFANTDNNITIAQDGTNLTFGLADQLNVKTGVTVGNSTLSSDGLAITGGPTISKGGIDAGNTIVSNIKDGVAATDAVSKGQLDKGLRDSGLIDADGNSIDAVTYTADGNVVLKDNDGKGTLISNVAAGKVTADSTDAINGSQLHAANSKVADALGGGSTVDANGNITAPVYSVDGKNVSNVGDAITNVDGRVTNNTTNITTNTNNIAGNTKNITDLSKTLTEGAFSVSANGEGATKVAKDAVIDFANTDNNITIAQDGTNLTFGLADQLNVKSGVTVGNSTLSSDGLAITGGPTISKGGIDAGNTIVSNIKDGVAATDAVSKGQLDKGLRDSGLIDADGNSIDAVTYTADGNVVLKDNDGKGTLISNVAAGKVTADSTDAINGSQLHGANSKVADALGGGSTVDANGNITAPVYRVDGKNVNNVGDAISNVDGRVTNNTTNITTNTNNIAGNTKNITDLSKTLTEGAFSVSANGEGATKVAKDAVIDFANTDNNITIAQDGTNLTFGLADQLNVKTGVTVGNSTLSSDGLTITGGPTISKGGIDAGNTIVSNIKDGVAATDAVSKGQLDKGLRDSGLIDADGNSIDAVTYTADGNVVLKDNDGKGTLISNVAAGKVTADSTDAINGSQLHSANSKVADALGGGSTVDANGNITAPVYSVDGKNVSNVGDAITNVDGRVTNNTTNITANTNNIADLGKTLTEGAFSVSANGTGAERVTRDAVIDYSNRDGNILISQNGSNFVFGLADHLNIKNAVTVGNSSLSSNGLVISGGPSITSNGIDAGNTIVSNIKDGVNANDAVSKGQLDRSLQASGLVDANGKAVDAVTYAPNGDVELKANNGQGTTLTNVAAGKVAAGSKDAINGGQLYDTTNSIANVIGGNTVVNSDGTISTSNIGGTGKDTIDDAIYSIQTQVAGAKSTVTAGKNVIVTATSNADGSQNFEVATADDLDVNSVTAKDVNASNVTAENITAKNVNVGNVKIDGTSNKVSGVANGTVSETSTDVVTGSQLHTTNSNVANYLGGGSSLNSDGSVSAPNYNVAGGSYHNVGDALTAVDSRVNNLEQAFYETNRSINDLKQNANAGIAGAMAVGNLPQPTEAGMSMVSAGASGYSGQSAIAIGVSGITDSNKIIWKMGGTADSKSNVGGAISVGYQWK